MASNKRSAAAAAVALASLVAESIAFSPRSTSCCIRTASQLHPPSTPTALAISQSTTSTRTQTVADDDDDDDNSVPWWKDFRLNDSALPISIIDDFPILTTTTFTDSQLTTTDNNSNNDDSIPLIYLDSAATSQKPTQVTNAIQEYYLKYNSNVHRGAHALSREATSLYEGARDKVTNFINARSRNEVVFTSGATEAINLVASSLSSYCQDGEGEEEKMLCVREGDEIIITEAEHHSNIVPWQMAAKKTGATLKYVPVSKNKNGMVFDIEAFEALLTPQTKMVSIQHISNVFGSINPISNIVQLVRSKSPNAMILLDACQSVPHTKVDVQSLEVDFIAASGHKMCGPTGIGFLWGKESLLNQLPPYKGGGEMIDQVYMDYSTYAPSPARFEAGTPPIAQAVGLGAAIDYLNNIGMERIHAYELELGQYLYKRLSEIEGVTVLGPQDGVERAALCAFVCDGVHPSDLSTFLDGEGVAIRAGHHCCQPLHRSLGYSHSARASLYFYNTKEDVDEFVRVLEETLQFFRSLSGGDDSEDAEDDEGFVPLF